MKDINMRRARKTWAVLIVSCFALVISAMLLGGCSQSGQSQSTKVGNAPTATVTSQAEQATFNHDVSIEPTVLVDNKVAKIEANAISFENDELNVDLSITNKSKKKFTCTGDIKGFRANFINNYMVDDGYFSIEVAPGKTEEVTTDIDSDNFLMYGISDIYEMGIGVKITKTDPFEVLFTDVLTLQTSLYDESVEYTNTFNSQLPQIAEAMQGEIINASDAELFNQSDIVISSPALVKNKDGDIALFLDIANNGQKAVIINFQDIEINGELVYEYQCSGEVIAPGRRAMAHLDLTSLAKNVDMDVSGSFSVKNIAFNFEVKDIKGNSVLPETGLEINF